MTLGKGQLLSPQCFHLRLGLVSTSHGGGKCSKRSQRLFGNRKCSPHARDCGRPSQGWELIPLLAVGVWSGSCPGWVVWALLGHCQVWELSLKMDHVLECECPNSAEVTWEKCLNTDYFQSLMNSVLQQVISWFCNSLADNTAPDVFNITTQAERPDKSWLHKDLATWIHSLLNPSPTGQYLLKNHTEESGVVFTFPWPCVYLSFLWPLWQTSLVAYPVAIILSYYWGWKYHILFS